MKTCEICRLSIVPEEDHHLVLTERRGKKQVAQFWYHAKCFSEKFLNQNKLRELIEDSRRLMKGIPTGQ